MSRTISATAAEWARQSGKPLQSLMRALARIGIDVSQKGVVITAAQFTQAIFGEEEESRRRLISAEADLKEQKAARQRNELYYWSEVESIVTNQVVLPITQTLNTIPTTYDVRCNPHDPELARTTLEQLVEDVRKMLRTKLSEPRKKE